MIVWLLNISVLFLLSYVAFRKIKSTFPDWVFMVALLLKLSAGITSVLIFKCFYGTGDAIAFFEAAKSYTSLSIKEHVYALFNTPVVPDFEDRPRVLFFVKLISVIVRISGDSFWLSSLYVSFISFLFFWYFTVILSRIYPHLKWNIVACFLFVPSVIFWSSGLLKESIANGAFILTIAFTIKMAHKRRLSVLELSIAFLSILLLYQVKHYLLITFLVFLGLFSSFCVLRRFSGIFHWLVPAIILVFISFLIQSVHPYLKVSRLAQTIYENNQAFITKTDVDNQIGIIVTEPNWNSILNEFPNSVYTGLFRPHIFDHTPAIGWVHKIENFFLLFLLIFTIIISIKEHSGMNWPVLFPSIISILLLAFFLCISTPNFGSLVRYKSSFIPFFALLVSILPFQYLFSKKVQ